MTDSNGAPFALSRVARSSSAICRARLTRSPTGACDERDRNLRCASDEFRTCRLRKRASVVTSERRLRLTAVVEATSVTRWTTRRLICS
eukprot:2286821-Pleurochrysis_carterae.AAC.1